RAKVAFERGETESAGDLVRNVPGPAAARFRGRIALTRGDASTSAREFRAVLEILPEDREALAGLGQALPLAGDAGAARPFTRAAPESDRLDWLIQNARTPLRRKDPRALQEIAEACQALGRTDLARGWYRLALIRDPLNLELQKAIYRLDVEPKAN